MTDILKIAANSQAYLFVQRDTAQDKFDVKKFVFGYGNAVAFSDAWAYWKMEEENGNRIDSTGNNHYGVPNDSDYVGQGTGKLGNCITLTGSDPYSARPRLDVNDPTPDLTGNFTISLWVKLHHVAENVGEFLEAISIRNDDGDSLCELLIGAREASGKINDIYIYTTDLWACEYMPDPELDYDVWHFICIYYDGTSLYLDVNNSNVVSEAGSTGILDDIDNVQIGFYATNAHNEILWNIDEIGIWESCLTADQRTQLYNSGNAWSPY